MGAGGLISHIAPTLCRKGIGKLKVLDRDIVEASNLNRQRFYAKDIGKNKAIALAKNLQHECIAGTEIRSYAMTLEQAIERRIDLRCDVAVCGIDNNPGRVLASRLFRHLSIPVVFCAVSRDGDLGYVFVQEKDGPCLGCLYPDIADDDRFPCPGTPAIADILQGIGSLAIYAIDTLVTTRSRLWNYRRFSLYDLAANGEVHVSISEALTLGFGSERPLSEANTLETKSFPIRYPSGNDRVDRSISRLADDTPLDAVGNSAQSTRRAHVHKMSTLAQSARPYSSPLSSSRIPIIKPALCRHLTQFERNVTNTSGKSHNRDGLFGLPTVFKAQYSCL